MHKGYFTRHSLRFKPSSTHEAFEKRADSVSSDIDVIGIHPQLVDAERVCVLSCKAGQSGFDPAAKVKEIEETRIVSGREACFASFANRSGLKRFSLKWRGAQERGDLFITRW